MQTSIFFSKSIFYIDIHCQNLSISNDLLASNIDILNIASFNRIHEVRQHIFQRIKVNPPLWLNSNEIGLLAHFRLQ